MNRIADFNWTPAWTSVIGCIHGCLQYLGVAPGLDWLFGGSGHGFIINMHRDGSCPSGPTAWKTTRFFDLGVNLGYSIEGIFGDKRTPGFEEIKEKAWGMVRSTLDRDLPVFGWELAIPEFYVVNGYDQTGYYFSGVGADQGQNPKPWNQLGETEIGILEIYTIQPVEKAPDRVVVRDALAFALEFNQGSPEWVLPEYRAGQEAYQVWIDALRSGKATRMGHAYNAAVWEECRRNGLEFLKEAEKRLGGEADSPFQGAIEAYGEVARRLKELTELYPFFENNSQEAVGDTLKSRQAAEDLERARAAEAVGEGFLQEICGILG
jgi:hypothetical protein